MKRGCLLFLLPASVAMAASPGAVLENRSGNRLMEQKKPEAAAKAYEKALQSSPDEPVLHYNHAGALAAQGEIPKAIEEYRKALTDAPSGLAADIHHNVGNLFMQQARSGDGGSEGGPQPALQQAVESYRQALRLRPGDPDSQYNLEAALKRLAAIPPPPPQPQSQPGGNSKEDSEPSPSDSPPSEPGAPSEPSEGERPQQPSEQPPAPRDPPPDSSSESSSGSSQESAIPKEPPPEPSPGGEASTQDEPVPSDRREAEQWLDRLAEEERQYIPPSQRGRAQETPPEKDW